MQGKGQHGDSELLKSFVPIPKMAAMAAFKAGRLEIFKRHLLLNCMSDSWLETSGQHQVSELLNSSVQISKIA